jgi:penicillin-binding protein 1A
MAFLRSRGAKILLVLGGLSTLAGFAAAVGFYWTFVRDLPDLKSIADYRPAEATRVTDRNGRPIGVFFEERRNLTPLDAIPPLVVQAFIASEDSTFFEHSGIDYPAILRAAWANLRAGGEIKQGASTITQQMVKGLLLTPERKLRRKIREMILARRIEQRFSKEEILYLYLNQIYFGHGSYGIGEAARTYFGKEVNELGVSEAALLAGLPKAPSRYSPFRNPDMAENRRRYVLTRMAEEGFIDRGTSLRALESPPEFAVAATEQPAAYFTEEVRRFLFDRLGGEQVLRGGLRVETTLDLELQRAAVASVRKGLRDLDHRQGFRGAVRQVAVSELPAELERLMDENALGPEDAGEFVEVLDGGELTERAAAALGERSLLGVVTEVFPNENYAHVEFAPGARATVRLADIAWARPPDPKRSPYQMKSIRRILSVGDVIPFAAVEADDEQAAADGLRVAIDQTPIAQGGLLSFDVASGEVLAMVGGYDFDNSQFNRVTQARRQPGSAFKPIIYAAALAQNYTPSTIVHDRPVVYTDEESGFVWRPNNYKRNFYGPITLREALARSINNATVHLFRDVGMDYVIAFARKLGIESPLTRDLSLALGSSGVSLLEITRAYGVFASGGRRVTPVFIRRVTDRDGQVLLENVPLGEAGEPDALDSEAPEVFVADEPAGLDFDSNGDPIDPDQVISPEQAYLATSLLRAVVEDPQGTGGRLRVLRRPLAGKTGTTNEQADAWFVGFSPDIATGVWVGHDETRLLGFRETGSRAAAPIWVSYMKTALKDRPKRDFAVPDDIVFARIDRKTGLLAEANSDDTVFQAFSEGTVPQETAHSVRSTSESRRQLRLDSF